MGTEQARNKLWGTVQEVTAPALTYLFTIDYITIYVYNFVIQGGTYHANNQIQC